MQEIVKPLIKWYQKNKRTLPWRTNKEPYHIWVSEVMLQQTRIEAVKSYYHRFINEIPDISTLSTISENKLLKLWEGLGYYNRARNLQKAAQQIVQNHNGIFPNTYDKIIDLAGIGEYTASAISSICFNEKRPTVDGNVLRVVMRLLNCYDNVLDPKVRESVKDKLEKIIPDNPGDFNEGMMELGETICLPKGTLNCEKCPLSNYCLSFQSKTTSDLPVRIKNTTKKTEEKTILLFYYKNKFQIRQRSNQTLLKDLWEFPSLDGYFTKKQLEQWLIENKIKGTVTKSIQNKHIFTHKIWEMKSFLIQLDSIDQYNEWITVKEAEEHYPIPTAFQPFLNILKEVCK